MADTNAPDPARSVAIIGDTHIGDSPATRYNAFKQKLAADKPTYSCLCHIGDLTENGFASEVAIAQSWWASLANVAPQRFLINGDHDLLQMSIGTWETSYGTTEFGELDLGWVRLIKTNYLIDAARRDQIIALCATQPAKPVFLFVHRPLRDTVLAGTAPHDGFTTGSPTYLFAQDATNDSLFRAAIDASANVVAVFSGHSHSWIDAPGFVTTANTGTRSVPYVNCSSITYVGGTKQFFQDPLYMLVATLLKDNTTVEIRYRDIGGGGTWVSPDTAGRVTTIRTTVP